MDNSSVIEGTAKPIAEMNLNGVLRIPAVRQVLLLVGVAASVAAGFALVLWSQTPGYAQLYGSLDGADTAEVVEALRAADIDYRLNTDTGSIAVPAARLHDARLELASRKLPLGAGGGMALLSENTGFGVSQFMETARYQHALEMELARTIGHVGAVRDVRVHLALPRESSFIRDRKKASASVLLGLHRGRALEADQAAAIVNLVASSVPNLEAGDVTLIDQSGRLLAAGGERWGAPAADPFNEARKLEEVYARRIEELLTPLVGPGRVRAQVVADLDFTVREETRESFDPERMVVRSERITEERRAGAEAQAIGVPGALSNQPPQAVPEAAADGDSTARPPIDSATSSTRNYEVDRTITHTRPERGRIERLSVAVLVDDGAAAAEAGEGAGDGGGLAGQPLSAAEIERYTALVKEAVGFNAARGDSVVVVNAPFKDGPDLPAADEPALWEKPLVRDVLKQVLGALLVLALAFGLVRPMLKSLVANHAAPAGEYLGAGAAAGAAPVRAHPALAGPSFDEKVAAARNITGHDPARVAQVVRKWVAASE